MGHPQLGLKRSMRPGHPPPHHFLSFLLYGSCPAQTKITANTMSDATKTP
jgi:hypothetical protein